MDKLEWHTEKRKVSELKLLENNPRKITKEQFKKLQEDIHEIGNFRPLVCDLDLTILGGNQRKRVATLDKQDEIEVSVPNRKLTEKERKKVIILDNEHRGEFDVDILANEYEDVLKELEFPDLNVPSIVEVSEDDFEEPEEVETDIKRGDVILLGKHRLMCGDSTSKEDVEKLMDGKKADMVFTDPPYGIELDTDTPKILGKTAKAKVYDRIVGDGVQYDPAPLFQMFGYVEDILLWGADYYAEYIPNKNEGAWLVWDKRVTGNEDKKNYASEFELCWSKKKRARRIIKHDWVIFYGMQNEDVKKRIHPNQKPTRLLVEIMADGGVCVVDLFGGSGSTLIACEQTNRVCYMMEIDPKYCEIICQRWEKFTEKKRLKIS